MHVTSGPWFDIHQDTRRHGCDDKDRLVDQIALILSDGVKQGAFEVADVKVSARAIFDATSRFHHPAHAEEWSEPGAPARIDALLALVIKGLEAPRKR